MITIYHLGVSQSDRVVWLMEELGLPYKLEWFDRGSDGMAPPEYRALHPAGTAPIIKDGDTVLGESAAIVEYISQRYAGGSLSVAPDQKNYADYLYWMQMSGNILSTFFVKLALARQMGVDPAKTKGLGMQNREDAYYKHLDTRLAECDYLAGDQFSCADILIFFNLTTLAMFGGRTLEGLPNIAAYVERISQRPAYIKAMEIAGPKAARP